MLIFLSNKFIYFNKLSFGIVKKYRQRFYVIIEISKSLNIK